MGLTADMTWLKNELKWKAGQEKQSSYGLVAHLLRVLSRYAKVSGLIPWSGHMQEATNESINKWNNK